MKVKVYLEEDLLPLSGLQHIAFCPRQWALIHVEQEWLDNILTAEGNILHERVHDSTYKEQRKDLFVTRSLPLTSYRLGVRGQADVVEFYRIEEEENTISIPGRRGLWRPRPVEYKRGKQKITNIDRVQLCAQAICLEEMYKIIIGQGDMFYWQTRRREPVDFTRELRAEVQVLAETMHDLYLSGRTPAAVYSKACRRCSLVDICLPQLANLPAVAAYIKEAIS